MYNTPEHDFTFRGSSEAIKKLMDHILKNSKSFDIQNFEHLFRYELFSVSKKVKASIEEIFREEVRQIRISLHKYEEKQKYAFKSYVFSLPERMDDLKALILEIENYPLKNITKKVKKLCKESNMCSKFIIRFVNKIKTSVIHAVVKEAISFEKKQFENYFESELKRINLDYYIVNESVKRLTPHYYQKHLEIVTKTVDAFHYDMKLFFKHSPYRFTVVWDFFDYITEHIRSLDEMQWRNPA